jgi:DNA-binding transcriptional MerR regulator
MYENFDPELVGKMAVSIGDASKITGVPIRKIRYWGDKNIIQSIDDNTGTNRKYDYYALKKILLIDEMIEEGYTLDKAAEKVNTRIQTIDQMHKAMGENLKNSSEDNQ